MSVEGGWEEVVEGGGVAVVRRDEEKGDEGGEESGPTLIPTPIEDVIKPTWSRSFNE